MPDQTREIDDRDITERLRSDCHVSDQEIVDEAAAEIERLRAEVERLEHFCGYLNGDQESMAAAAWEKRASGQVQGKPRCKTCDHFDPNHPTDGYGWCRRFPPHALPYWPVDEGSATEGSVRYHGPGGRGNLHHLRAVASGT